MREKVTGAVVQLIDDALVARTVARARESERKRATHNFHATHADASHRFLNALVRGTYVAPHRHVAILKPEGFLLLQGELAVVVFGDDGAVLERHILGRNGVRGIDLPPGIWHTIAPVSDVAVCYEVKPGPWDPLTDKEFAPWAPLEGDPKSAEYLAQLMARIA
ncbi:MAG TPA: WbuC family cupin fold metalloprotein [Polyangiaceae bacterium]